ncbi:hypothetical protein GCM10025858_00970 [Alicyclobacillus sacchari]|nr:hypothetical protein GCM10025858_00970 [Alicyclobacillus sacchari]
MTAGNSSQMSDGAAAAVIMSAERAQALGLKPLATFRSFAVTGCDPAVMGIGPVGAIPKALKIAGISLADVDLFEINEAFAAQCVQVMRALEIDPAKVNVNGGAIALGHPLGCTGAKLTATLVHELRRGGGYGVVSMCIGGGMGAARIRGTPRVRQGGNFHYAPYKGEGLRWPTRHLRLAAALSLRKPIRIRS